MKESGIQLRLLDDISIYWTVRSSKMEVPSLYLQSCCHRKFEQLCTPFLQDSVRVVIQIAPDNI